MTPRREMDSPLYENVVYNVYTLYSNLYPQPSRVQMFQTLPAYN